MKFELFGKLRDNGNDNSDAGNTSPTSNDDMGGLGGNSGPTSQLGGGLEDNVQQMFSQGYSEEEIRQELQGQYSENEINQAVNRTIKSSATGGNSQQGGGPEPMTPYNGGDDTVSPMDEGYGQDEGEEQMNQNNQQPPMDQGMNQGGGQPNPEPLPQQGPNNNQNNANGNVNGSVEELVETIVAENLERVEREFENAYSEIDELKQKIDEIDERVHDLEVRDDEDQTQFIQKMDELEEDIDSYQARMGGLEKAFQQILPSLVDNVRDLTSLVQEIKQERGIETEANMNEDDIQDIDMEDW